MLSSVQKLYAEAYPGSYVLLATRDPHSQNPNAVFVQCAIRVTDLKDYLYKFIPPRNVDVYLTANTFRHKKGGFSDLVHYRRDENLMSLNNIVVDIDCHTAGLDNASSMQLLGQYILATYHAAESGDMPMYGAYSLTGRGVHFWYPLLPLAPACRFLYKTAVSKLIEQHNKLIQSNTSFSKTLTTDSSSSQRLSGLFRLENTYNTAVGKKSIFCVNELPSSPLKTHVPHIKELLCKLGVILPDYKPAVSEPSKEAALSESLSHRLPQVEKYSPLLMMRRNLIEWLVENRNVMGRRNCLAFLYYNDLKQIFGNKEIAHRALIRLNHHFEEPLGKDELAAIMDNVDTVKGGIYKFKQKTFFQFGSIGSDERRLFDVSYKPPSILKREAEQAKKRSEKEQRNDRIRELALSGMSQHEIADSLNIGVATVNRVIKPNNAIDTQQIKKEAQLRKISAMLEAGKSRKDIAKAIGISSATLARRIADMRK